MFFPVIAKNLSWEFSNFQKMGKGLKIKNFSIFWIHWKIQKSKF